MKIILKKYFNRLRENIKLIIKYNKTDLKNHKVKSLKD